ncbi:---NA--- [Octopus vulgaris]|uniref:---NA n=1 Tax=Octopus vulgaris TaxID=6645 RepID=A0AA36EWU9_OCTVU|nr:---NA--- [Octopus vulgaris]
MLVVAYRSRVDLARNIMDTLTHSISSQLSVALDIYNILPLKVELISTVLIGYNENVIILENIELCLNLRNPDYISSMPKATKLCEIEQEKILALKAEGMSNQKIAEKIRRSRMPVDNFLKDPNSYNRVHAGGRSKATSAGHGEEVTMLLCFQNKSTKRENLHLHDNDNPKRAPVTDVTHISSQKIHLFSAFFKPRSRNAHIADALKGADPTTDTGVLQKKAVLSARIFNKTAAWIMSRQEQEPGIKDVKLSITLPPGQNCHLDNGFRFFIQSSGQT